MRNLITLSAFALLTVLPACYQCEQCTAIQGEFGEVSREICGRRQQREQLITELESDTIGTGPWVCE